MYVQKILLYNKFVLSNDLFEFFLEFGTIFEYTLLVLFIFTKTKLSQ